MDVLLDTCAFVWLCCDPDRFSPKARQVFTQGAPITLYISDATILEIVVKNSLGKIELPDAPRKWVKEQCQIWGINVLPITHEEICASSKISLQLTDPFDKLIVATAKTQTLPMITDEQFFKVFGVDVIW